MGLGAAGRSGRGDRGITAVELGILLPFVLLFVFGVIDFTRVLNAQISLTRAAYEGVQVSAIGAPNVAAAVIDTADPITVSKVTVTPCPPEEGRDAKTTVVANATVRFITPLAIVPGLGDGMNLTGRRVARCYR